MRGDIGAANLVTVRVPMALRKYGGTKRIVAPDGGELSPQLKQPDSTLVKALARAFRWRKLLENRTFNTITDLAMAERINPSYVSRILRLSLLAPDIIEAILSGKLNSAITIDQLMKPLSSNWHAQREQLGAASRNLADRATSPIVEEKRKGRR